MHISVIASSMIDPVLNVSFFNRCSTKGYMHNHPELGAIAISEIFIVLLLQLKNRDGGSYFHNHNGFSPSKSFAAGQVVRQIIFPK